MLDDSSVLSEIYSPDQRARVIDVLSASPVALEKRSLWRKKAGDAGYKNVLVELDELRAKQMRDARRVILRQTRVTNLLVLLVLLCI
jgi:hypothetical protein